jgi:hypothetical protein
MQQIASQGHVRLRTQIWHRTVCLPTSRYRITLAGMTRVGRDCKSS